MPVEERDVLIGALRTVTFRDGKHKGKTFDEVLSTDPPYAKWVNSHAEKRLDRVFFLYALMYELAEG